MMMRASSATVLILMLLSACATSPPPAPVQPHLVRQPAFTDCELEAFIAFGTGRQATQFNQPREAILSGPNAGPLQVALADEWFARMAAGSRDYAGFAAERFYRCAERRALPVAKDLNGASVCMARQEIPHLLYARKQMGFSQEQALIVARRVFGRESKAIYPPELVEQTAPMAYRVQDADGFYDLRRFMFESCLFPTEWQAWWDSEHPPAGGK